MEDKATKDLLAIMGDVAEKVRQCEYVTSEYETLVKLFMDLYRVYMDHRDE